MKLVNRLKFTTTATSLASVTSFASIPKFRTLAQAIADGKLTLGQSGLQFLGEDANSWEESYFTVGGTAQNPTLTRDRVSDSSNGGNPATFSGVVTMSCTVLAEDLIGVSLFDLTSASSVPDTFVMEVGDPSTSTSFKATVATLRAIFGAPADTIAPTLSSPTSASTGTTTGSGSVTTNEANGTLYYLATANITETAATVKANGATKAVTAAGSIAVTVSGLTASAAYYLHFLHRDAAGNDSAVSNSASFTTAAAGDTTAPTLSSPTAAQSGSTTATGSVSTNEANGTLYTYASTNAVESATTVKASGATQAVAATGVQNVNVTGLTASTTYYLHFLHRDAAGNDSTVSNSASFTTAAAAPQTAYTITGYNGNAVKSTIDLSGVAANGSGKKYAVAGTGGTGQPGQFTVGFYWNIAATSGGAAPASAKSGWGTSATVPPAEILVSDNNNSTNTPASMQNGLVPMNHPGAFESVAYLWVNAGDNTPKYFWVEPVDGPAQCLTPAGVTITGA